MTAATMTAASPVWNLPAFAAALRRAEPEPPSGLHGAARSRFAVYRNNVAVGWIRALETRFSAVAAIVGEEFFRAMARDFVAEHPPTSPVLAHFGDGFADFIAAFPPAGEMPYLADIARIEAARTDAYHAADLSRLGPDDFAKLAPESLGDLRVTLHPAIAIQRSRHPIWTIFAMNSGSLPAAPIEDWRGEDVLIDRPRFDVETIRLRDGEAAFWLGLRAGETLGIAIAVALREAPSFDAAAVLADLIGNGRAIGLQPIFAATA